MTAAAATDDHAPGTQTGIEYLDIYNSMRDHQAKHDSHPLHDHRTGQVQPTWNCMQCLRESPVLARENQDLRRRYSWAVANKRALDTIAAHSPGGVVEIGAGGGYWAMLLQQRDVDVIAYDPDPPGMPADMSAPISSWHSGRAWTAVHLGDHRQAGLQSTRTLLLCWPSYDEPWAAQALDHYEGDTVIYIGEGPGGCTADDRFHALLGQPASCYEDVFDDGHVHTKACMNVPARFEEVTSVEIPQWAGLHDQLSVYRRIAEVKHL